MSRGVSGKQPSRDRAETEEAFAALREHGSCAFKNGEGGIRTHEAAFTAHTISSRAP